MKKASFLGPNGTYCSLAMESFLKDKKEYTTNCFSSINEVLGSLDDNEFVLVPYENSLDGYVIEVIDKLLENKCYITDSLTLPIDFTYISNKPLSETKKVYVQFKARKQCLKFLKKNNLSFMSTESNVSSMNNFLEQDLNGAIVPTHLVTKKYPFCVKQVADRKDNFTRFVVIKKELPNLFSGTNLITVSIKSKTDKPGLLIEILKSFQKNNINIRSIMSRPTKDSLGSYNFFMEFSIKKENYENINNLIVKLNLNIDFEVKILGICQE